MRYFQMAFILLLMTVLASCQTSSPVPSTATTLSTVAPLTTNTVLLPSATFTQIPTPVPTDTFTPEPRGDGVHWRRYPGNPVLDVGPAGAWDSALVGEPRVFRSSQGFTMVYVGQDGTKEGGSISPFYGYGLGLAESADGIHWERASSPAISLKGSQFGMLWHGSLFQTDAYQIFFALGETRSGRVGYRIYRAVSADGLAWTTSEKPVVELGKPGSYDGFDITAPAVMFDDGVYKMWYNASDVEGHITIAYATSADGLVWEKHAANPVLDLGPKTGAYYPSVLKIEGVFWMWFTHKGGIHLATSPDGLAWELHPANPVFTKGEPGAWDGEAVLEPSVYFDGRVFHLWYTGSSGPFLERIGYATSP